MADAYRAEIAAGILRITFDRPEAGNALPPEAVDDLTALFRTVSSDCAVRAVLIGANFLATL